MSERIEKAGLKVDGALAHFGVADLNRVEYDVIKPLQRNLVALIFFELRRLQAVGLQNLQVAFLIETARDLELWHLRQLIGNVVVGS